jgi:hypothetical protein
MKTRRRGLVPWLLVGVFVLCVAMAAPLGWSNGDLGAASAPLLSAFTAFMAVGALIVARRPENALGWVFSTIGLIAATGWLAQEYAEYAYLTKPGSLPAPLPAAWYANWYWYPLISLALAFTVLLFPTGRPLSRGWVPLQWGLGIATATVSILAALDPLIELQDEHYSIANPIGVSAVGNIEESFVGAVLFGIFSVCTVLAFVSLVMRFRRSRGEERQQLKWFTSAGGAIVVIFLMEDLIPGIEVADYWFGISVALVPISVGVAILRYRLYDIDRIINKTLVYGAVTAVLALGYGGLVLGLQSLLPTLARDSAPAVAVSTLAMVALFRPLRNRVQGVVDRRFYRRRYDAARTIESFGSRLRHETDLDSLQSDLLGLVNLTMQPVHASLWLRPTFEAAPGNSRAYMGSRNDFRTIVTYEGA